MKFSKANAKLRKLAKDLDVPKSSIFSFDLPAGHTCPGAQDCLSKADKNTGKITDGKHTVFRCYAASAEATYTNTRKARWENMNEVRLALRSSVSACANKLIAGMPAKAQIIRIHSSGDFFSKRYLQAWIEVAKKKPNVKFYAYTKSLKILNSVGQLPNNLHINISMGGKFDDLARGINAPHVYVVADEMVALKRGLKVDTTDSIACSNNRDDFALVVHGVQPKGGHRLK